MLLILVYLITVLPGSISGLQVDTELDSGDADSDDLCKLSYGIFPVSFSCRIFIRCRSGEPEVEFCSHGLFFNLLKLTCDFSETGNCSDFKQFETSANFETNDITCSEQGPNMYPNQSNCTEYYICESNTAFKIKCPQGLLMNAEKWTCDYPENVECDLVSNPEDIIVVRKVIYSNDKDEVELKNESLNIDYYTTIDFEYNLTESSKETYKSNKVSSDIQFEFFPQNIATDISQNTTTVTIDYVTMLDTVIATIDENEITSTVSSPVEKRKTSIEKSEKTLAPILIDLKTIETESISSPSTRDFKITFLKTELEKSSTSTKSLDLTYTENSVDSNFLHIEVSTKDKNTHNDSTINIISNTEPSFTAENTNSTITDEETYTSEISHKTKNEYTFVNDTEDDFRSGTQSLNLTYSENSVDSTFLHIDGSTEDKNTDYYESSVSMVSSFEPNSTAESNNSTIIDQEMSISEVSRTTENEYTFVDDTVEDFWTKTESTESLDLTYSGNSADSNFLNIEVNPKDENIDYKESTINMFSNIESNTTVESKISTVVDEEISISEDSRTTENEYFFTNNTFDGSWTGIDISDVDNHTYIIDTVTDNIQTMSATETANEYITDTTEVAESNIDYSNISNTNIRFYRQNDINAVYQFIPYSPAALTTEKTHLSSTAVEKIKLRETSLTDGLFDVATTLNQVCSTWEGNFPYPDDCSKFYHCTKGIPVLSSCVEDEHFDTVKRICTSPYLANCDPNVAAVRTEKSDAFSTAVLGDEIRKLSLTDGISGVTISMNPVCATSEGNFPYPDDCSKFYHCTKGIPVLSSCVGNEHFDVVKRICTSPCLANCDPNADCFSKLPTSVTLLPLKPCDRNDFIALPNCSEYVDCTNDVPIDLKCPVGLHFNPTTRVCDWPYKAECGMLPKPLFEPINLLSCPCKSCLIPSTISCSQYFLCLDFTAYKINCSYNLHFDKNRNTCNYAHLVDCYDEAFSNTTKITFTESSTTSTIGVSIPPTKTTTETEFVCPNRKGLFKYTGNCGMFYKCFNWYPYPLYCGGKTHFNENTKRCEYPCDAKCDLNLDCESPLTSFPRDPKCSCFNCKLPTETCTNYIACNNGKARIEYCPWGQTFDVEKSTCDWTYKVTCQRDSICPERDGIFPHKDDCHKFLHCSNGIPYIKDCPHTFEYDPVKKYCERPSGNCNHLPVMGTEVKIFKTEKKTEGWRCPKTFGYFSDMQHCNKFYHCSFGVPTLKECSPGLLYNSRYQTCDWEKEVQCNSNFHLKARRCRYFDDQVACSDERNPQPHVLCNMYYDCTTGRACAKKCPMGLYFNYLTGLCNLPENVKCFYDKIDEYSSEELRLKCASGFKGRMVNPKNDACFYHCKQRKVVSACCSKGRIYNFHKHKCERKRLPFRI